MGRKDLFNMSHKEIDRLKVIQAVMEKRLKQGRAAQRLGITTRQVRRLCRRMKREGVKGLVHGLRGEPSNHRLKPKLLEQALERVRKQYPDFGPTFANEKLKKIDKLFLSTSVLRAGMIDAGLWTPGRSGKRHRAWRERRPCVGELVQLDGSEHDWFEGRGPWCALLAFIDDATSRILHAEFVPVEDTLSLMGAVKTYLRLHGRPMEFYVDRDSVYKINRQATVEEELRDAQPLTQFTRAMEELGIGMIFALSPQAKGRVERTFRTHQDRLVKELRLAGIATMEEANKFLKEVYLPDHNARCAVAPAEAGDAHRGLVREHRLEEILSLRVERGVAQDFTVRYQNRFFQILAKQPVRVRPKNRVWVETRLDGSVHLRFKGAYLRFKALPERPLRPVAACQRPGKSAGPRPGTLEYARRVKVAA